MPRPLHLGVNVLEFWSHSLQNILSLASYYPSCSNAMPTVHLLVMKRLKAALVEQNSSGKMISD